PLPPVLEEIFERHLERNRGLPAGGAPELRAVTEQERDVGGPHPRRILAHLDLHVGEVEEDVEHLARRVAAARADVVDLPGLAALEGEPVGPDHVTHVREIADRFEVAYPDHGLMAARLDLGHLAGEVRGDEDLRASPTTVG